MIDKPKVDTLSQRNLPKPIFKTRRLAVECVYCKRPFKSASDKTIDHLIPKAKGGTDELENLVVACKDCNQWKGDTLISEFIQEVETYLKNNKTINFKTYTRIDLQNIINYKQNV